MKASSAFLQKSAQKTLTRRDRGFDATTAHVPDSQKFFGSFFQKRTASLLNLVIVISA
jgi:hypothetical protein